MSVLKMTDIHKSFSGVSVLRGVHLTVQSGEVVGLLGENGAGKSTLMKILTGEYRADSGEITLDGQSVSLDSIHRAKQLGFGMIHQELNLFQNLSIAENFLIGNEHHFNHSGFVNYRQLNERVKQILQLVNLQRTPTELLSSLGVGEQQLVEIGKSLLQKVRFLAMDEPTSALSQAETERLFQIIQSLCEQGVGVIYISHRLDELFHITHRVTVLRDGKFIATKPVQETNEEELVSLMVGRSIEDRYPTVHVNPGPIVMKTVGLQTAFVKNVDLTVCAGEIVGLGGLMGSGRTEVARALTGVDRVTSGHLQYMGNPIQLRSPQEAIRAGIAYVTEDRKELGLVLPFSLRANVSLPTLPARTRFGLVQRDVERDFARDVVEMLHIKVHDIEDPVESLSGGNQQKVVLAKWLAQKPSLFVLDEPTRGVDVGAKQEIYQLMNELKQQGKAILLISSDLPELLAMSDRVYVMHEGHLQGELPKQLVTEEAVMRLATGGSM
ncbi:sugar ABC transporter ATP-binding protein [Alicyclobacillaceae bacterium I2511]|jgi:ribose transport system ATP-binding protein|nr:sugar ABC transporter ATP-binding protein [Alicyclobacillaceae bacterium I2511]